MIIGGSALPLPLARAARRARHRRHRRLRHVGDLPDPHARAPAPAHAATGTRSASCRTRAARGGRFRSCSLRIVDADMNDVAHDGVAQGEVVVRSPWLTQGYLRRARAVRGAVARRLAAHRRRRRHRRRGLPEDRRPHQGRREDRRRMGVLARHRGPRAAHAGRRRGGGRRRARRQVGRASGRVRGAQGRRATRRPRRRSAGTSQEFAERGAISKYAVPDRVYFVDAIPKTSVGKLDKKVIRAQGSPRKRNDVGSRRSSSCPGCAITSRSTGRRCWRPSFPTRARVPRMERDKLSLRRVGRGARPLARGDRRAGRARRAQRGRHDHRALGACSTAPDQGRAAGDAARFRAPAAGGLSDTGRSARERMASDAARASAVPEHRGREHERPARRSRSRRVVRDVLGQHARKRRAPSVISIRRPDTGRWPRAEEFIRALSQ